MQWQNRVKNVTLSSLYRTKPMYVENQDDFLNMVVCGDVEDDEDPFDFLKKILYNVYTK